MTLTYSKITQKVIARLVPGVIFSMDMQNILGFDRPFLTETAEAQSVVDMAQGFYSLYVYTKGAATRPRDSYE